MSGTSIGIVSGTPTVLVLADRASTLATLMWELLSEFRIRVGTRAPIVVNEVVDTLGTRPSIVAVARQVVAVGAARVTWAALRREVTRELRVCATLRAPDGDEVVDALATCPAIVAVARQVVPNVMALFIFVRIYMNTRAHDF